MRFKKRFEELKDKIKNFLINNKAVTFLFVLSLAFFFYQHYSNLSWDFASYVLNARYFFYGGSYFELLRPPLAPLLLGFFLILGKVGEYVYILFVTCLFFYSSIKLADLIFNRWADKYVGKNFVRLLFPFFGLGYSTLFYAVSAGTELLSLALFQLFLFFYLKDKISGHFLALAFLTRYNFMIFFPFLLLNRDWKKIFKNIALALIVVLPWLLFNYLNYGNWLASVISSFSLNIFNRGYLETVFNFNSVLGVIGWFLPFFILGLCYSFWRKKSLEGILGFIKEKKYELIFLIVFLLIIYSYSNIPYKKARFLFNLALPVAFFSTIGVLAIIRKYPKSRKIIYYGLIFAFCFTVFLLFLKVSNEETMDKSFYSAAQRIDKLGLAKCEILSPHWVPVSYYTGNVYPLKESPRRALRKKKIILVFNTSSIDHDFRFGELGDKYEHIYAGKEYIFLGEYFKEDNCSKKYVYDEPYTREYCVEVSQEFEGIGLKNFSYYFCKLFNQN